MLARPRKPRRLAPSGALLAALVVIGSSLVGLSSGASIRAVGPAGVGGASSVGDASLASIDSEPLVALTDASSAQPASGAVQLSSPGQGTLTLVLSLGPQHGSGLAALAANLTDPNSSQYHRYLSSAAVTTEFGPSETTYEGLVRYLGAAGATSLVTFPDRLSVEFDATPAALAAAFHAPVDRFSSPAGAYSAFAAAPTLPASLATAVVAITGLGPSAAVRATTAGTTAVVDSAGVSQAALTPATGYPSPVNVSGKQYLYASDLQVAYDEEGLLDQYGAPTSTGVAAILFDGSYGANSTVAACSVSLSPGEAVGPYDPADLASYLATTVPSSEPTATYVPVVASGPAPGCTASYDTTGTVASNTAELEALGSIAPGATVYTVSTVGPSVVNLTAALEEVLSPPTTVPVNVRAGLANVTVIAIDWGAADVNTTAWSDAMAVAAARGLTVVAAAGNSADNPASPAWVGSDAEFPASDATETTGVLAVGGTTLELNPTTLHIRRESVWDDATAPGGPIGTSSGVSLVYREPAFAKATSANDVLKGDGRGVPDVAAVANNTLVTLTRDGYQYLATNATSGGTFVSAAGTAVSAGVVAGLLAVVDHTLRLESNPALGYADPTLYALGNEQYALPTGTSLTVSVTGSYDYGLPTTPFRDVTAGSNGVDAAAVGYDLVSGWGSIDAYNLTMYVLTTPTTGVYGDLGAVEDEVHVGPLQVTTTSSSGVTNSRYNVSIQQNLFVANAMGAPVYGVQSIIYGHRSSSSWAVNFTAWVSYPFPGLYPTGGVREYHFPATGDLEVLPITFTLTTTLVPGKGSTPPELKFSYGVPGSVVLTINVPGASFIIGETNYSYLWQGSTYTDGPRAGVSAHGYLAPQLVIVGAPNGGIGRFSAGSKGSIIGLVEPSGSSTFVAAHLGLVGAANTQSAESAVGLGYTSEGSDVYDFAYSAGATTYGVLQVQPSWFPVHIEEANVPADSLWYVNLTSGASYSATGASPWINVSLPNGTYEWSGSTDVRNWSSDPSSGSFTVAGGLTELTLTFGPAAGSVTFAARAPTKDGQLVDFVWYVNLTGAPSYVGVSPTYNASLPYGTYDYHIASSNKSWGPAKGAGTVTVSRAPQTIYTLFSLQEYLVQFDFQLPKSPPRITISMDGYSDTGSFGTWGLDLPNGTYSWSVSGVPLGYLVTPASGTVHVDGATIKLSLSVTEPGWGPFGLGVIGWALVAGVPALLGAWLAVVYSRRRKRAPGPPKEPPPKKAAPPPRPKRRPPRATAPRREPRYVRPDDL